jgi:hypothetical protein
MRVRRILTPEQVQEILKLYPNMESAKIAEMFNTSISNIYKTANRYKVKKSEDFNRSDKSGRIQKGQRLSVATEFKKGVPNKYKGKKRAEFVKPSKLKNFHLWKKGNKPPNTGKDGEIRWRYSPGYYFIRISENNWEFYHRYLWYTTYGEIPEGYNVVFRDGNRRNCKIENLECISNAELGERNRHTKYPLEIRKAIETRNKLDRVIKEFS